MSFTMGDSLLTGVQGLLKSPVAQQQFSLNAAKLPNNWSYEHLQTLPYEKLLELLQQIPGMLEAKTIELKTVLPSVIKLCASNNSQIKDAVCDVLVIAAEVDPVAASEIGLLVGNILIQDLSDPNPAVRCTAVAAICSISVLAKQHAFSAISNGFKDSNPKVRKSAVIGCGKVWRHSPQLIEEYGLIDMLYTIVRDPDPNVLTFAMQTLNIILKDEGGIVINVNMASYLLQRLNDCPEVERVFLMDYLHLYNPENDTPCLKIFNALDIFLEDKSAPVILSAARLFYAVITKMIGDSTVILKDFMLKISPQITRFMKGHANHEFQCSVMTFITELSNEGFIQLTPIKDNFYFKPKDYIVCKGLKCQILFRFCELNIRNSVGTCSNDIVDYFLLQLSYQSSIGMELVSYICRISSLCADASDSNLLPSSNNGKEPSDQLRRQKIKQTFLDVLSRDESKLRFTQMILSHIRTLTLELTTEVDQKLIDKLCRNFLKEKETLSSANKEPILVINFLWLLQNHCNHILDSPYILEEVVDYVTAEGKSVHSQRKYLFYCRLLTAAAQIFLSYPSETQHVLGKTFELCKLQSIPELDEKTVFYSRLLQCDSFYGQT